MLLRRMADYQPGLVEDKVRELGLPRSAVAAAHQRWQAMIRSRSFPGGNDRFRRILGRPAAEFRRQLGDLTCEITQWEADLWPPLRFETVTLPGGPVLQQWLVRPGDCPPPAVASAADLRPWGCVVADVIRGLGPAERADDEPPSRWDAVFAVRGTRYRTRFAWGLLQAAEPDPPGSAA